MLGFGSINFNKIGIPSVGVGASDVVDAYDKVMESKNNYIAVKLANENKTKKRASATMIGATFGMLQVGIFTGAYGLIKMYPKLNNKFFRKLFVDSFDNWIAVARRNHPNSNTFSQVFHGIASKAAWAVLSSAVLGYACDLYTTLRNTRVNKKISNTTAGAEGSIVASGLKSLSATQQGKELIRNAMEKNKDGSITIKFNGVGREYNITKKELKKASREYISESDENGKVKNFQKKFSKGDGDTLAFEVAFEKYCNDVANGRIERNKNIPLPITKLSDDGDILFANCPVSSFYFLMTGNPSAYYNPEHEKNDNIDTVYSKAGIYKFLHDYSHNPDKYIAEIKLKDTENSKLRVRDKYFMLHDIKTNKKYAITNINKKYITLTDTSKTRKSVCVPISAIKDNIEILNYSEMKDV